MKNRVLSLQRGDLESKIEILGTDDSFSDTEIITLADRFLQQLVSKEKYTLFINSLGENSEVPSPTFTLVQSYYLNPTTVHHFDLYRLEKSEDAFELGIEELFVDGISLIEWPERLGSF